jgi:predicted small secreted protein
MNFMRKEARIFILALFALSSLSLAACETVEGAGRDIENAGEAIQKKADD